jgi:proteic killer suppression protein
MKVVFRDKRLAWIRTTRAAAETRLPIAVIASCQKKLFVLENAPDERTLRGLVSLRYEKLRGDREGQHSVRLNDQWRLIFILHESTPPTIEVLEIVDYH